MLRALGIIAIVTLGWGAAGPASAHVDLDTQLRDAAARIALHPRDARAWLHRAELYRMRGAWEAAESDYRLAARLDPELDVIDLCRGRMLAQSGRPAEALPPLDRFLRGEPRHVEGLAARARVKRALGDGAGAAADWDRALSAANDEDARPEYFLERADAVLLADRGATGRAVAGLVDGYRRLGGAVTIGARIHELDPTRPLPPPAPATILPVQGASVVATTLVRGPYLQRGTPTSVVIRWRTGGATDGVVRYGAAPNSLTGMATQMSVTTNHNVTVSGLTAGTRYYYSIGSSTETLAGGTAEYVFTTSPAPGTTKPFRVWVLGDSGTANANSEAVRNAYMTFTGARPTDLWIMLGDNAYPDGTDAEYQQAVFDMYPSMLRKSVLWPTFGNHDGHSADSASLTGPYYDIFSLPRAAEAGGVPSGTEAYYSFDYGNAHFVCLDSYESSRSSSGAMLTWLAQDLAATSKDWIIAFWHHPPYTKGSHNSDVEGELIDMRENANPILEAHGVDLVLTGHSHSYERSLLIDGHYDVAATFAPALHVKDAGSGRPAGDGAYEKPSVGPDPHEGTVYAVAGSSGQISGGPLDHPAMYLSLNLLGSMVLDFNGNRLDATFLDAGGIARDTFSVIKQPSLPPQTNFEASPLVGAAPLNVQFTDRTLNGPIAWSWDLDGNAAPDSTSQNPSHVYSTAGLYTVSLAATNVGGTVQATKTGYVCVTAASPPGPVAALSLAADRSSLSWSAPPLAATFDLVRGDLGVLRATGGDFAAAASACVENDGSDATGSDPAAPAAGAGFWYLVRASDCAGRPGTYDDGTQVIARDSGLVLCP